MNRFSRTVATITQPPHPRPHISCFDRLQVRIEAMQSSLLADHFAAEILQLHPEV